MFFKKKKSWPQLVWKLVRANYFISIIAVIILFVGLIAAYKLLSTEDEYIYAKIKISQGLWWANTTKPAVWMVDAIKKGDVEVSLSGKPTIEVLEVRNYPWWSENEHIIYVIARLKVSKNEKTGEYSFKRSSVSVASPIDLELQQIHVSGVVMDFSEKPFKNNSVEKTITIFKEGAYSWEGDAMQVGDNFFNGEEKVLEITDIDIEPSYQIYSSIGNNYPIEQEQKINIKVKAKVRVEIRGDRIVFGDEQSLKLGKTFNVSTSKFALTNFKITSIE